MASNDPNELMNSQRHKSMKPREDVRGTLETVNLEQRERNASGPVPVVVINGLAIVGAIAIIYVVVDLIF